MKFRYIIIRFFMCFCIVAMLMIKCGDNIQYDDTTKDIEIDKIENNIEIEPVKNENKVVEDSPTLISLGEFKLTAYCSCEICCGVWAENRPNGVVYGSIGIPLTTNYSIAVDPDVIPYGTKVIINGNTYEAQDCGGAINNNDIDIYFGSHEEALEFGVQYAEVFVVNE